MALRSLLVAALLTSVAGSFYDLEALDIDKKPFDFGSTRGQVVMIVNVATYCGFTAQNYKEFPEILGDYSDKVQIVAFPCNQFGEQEPGTNEEIKRFAESQGFTGVLMDKVNANDPGEHPVYKWLKEQSGNPKDISWNFAKFLVTPDGRVHSRHKSNVSPNDLRPVIDSILAEFQEDVEEL